MAKDKKTNKNNKNLISFMILCLCILLVVMAAVGGYAYSRKLAGDITSEAEKDAFDPAAGMETPTSDVAAGIEASASGELWHPDNNQNDGAALEDSSSEPAYDTTVKLTPLNLIFGTNPGTGRIEHMVIECLDSLNFAITYIYIEPEISYTMSSTLYRKLANKNALLPQSVTFTELYNYYKNDKAYEAGRSILSEMLGYEIDYYTALPLGDFMSVFRIVNETDGKLAKPIATKEQVFSKSEAGDTSADYIKLKLKNAVTSWPEELRMKYVPIYDSVEASAVKSRFAPVKRSNETTELDCSGTAAIIYKTMYSAE